MPIFEYTCSKCGEAFSVLKLGSTEVDTNCPKCGSADTAKQMSSFCSVAPGSSGGAGGTGGGFGGG